MERVDATTMKILTIGTSVLPLGGNRYGGVEKLQLDFIRGLLKFGQDVTVAAPQDSKVPEGVKLIETVRLPQEQDHDELAAWRCLQFSTPFDIVHDFSHTHGITKFTNEAVPAIFHIWHPAVYKYNQAKYNCITLSNWQKGRFEKLYDQKAITMPMCVNTDIYKPISNPKRERFLFLGKISPEKGVDLAIKYARDMGIGLDVCGGLIQSELSSTYVSDVHKLCDGERIKFHFNITEEEKISFLQNAKALIYPVRQEEAHWLTGMEAWCIGLPTIVFNKGAMKDVAPFTVDTEAQFKAAMAFIGEVDTTQIREKAITQYGVDSVIPKYLYLYKWVSGGERW